MDSESLPSSLPHYVRRRIELKKQDNDPQNYFLSEWIDPDSQRMKQKQDATIRRRKSLEFAHKVRSANAKLLKSGFHHKQKLKQTISESDNSSNTMPPIEIMSVSKDTNTLNVDFTLKPERIEKCHDQMFSELVTSTKSKQENDVNDPKLKALQLKLAETQRKYLNFMLRGNPTHKKQVEEELQWLFAQIRSSVAADFTKKQNDEDAMMRNELELLKKEVLRQNKVIQSYEAKNHGMSSKKSDQMKHRLARCIEALCHLHGIRGRRGFGFQRNDRDLSLEEMVKRLEGIVMEAGTKKMVRTNSKRKKSIKKKENSLNPKMKKEGSTIHLKRHQKDLQNLNERVINLDSALQESSTMLDEILNSSVSDRCVGSLCLCKTEKRETTSPGVTLI